MKTRKHKYKLEWTTNMHYYIMTTEYRSWRN